VGLDEGGLPAERAPAVAFPQREDLRPGEGSGPAAQVQRQGGPAEHRGNEAGITGQLPGRGGGEGLIDAVDGGVPAGPEARLQVGQFDPYDHRHRRDQRDGGVTGEDVAGEVGQGVSLQLGNRAGLDGAAVLVRV